MHRCYRIRPKMSRCSVCHFARYCSSACSVMSWCEHRFWCRHIRRDDYKYEDKKADNDMCYGHVSGYDFQLIRHIAMTSDGVAVYDNKDFSVGHKNCIRRYRVVSHCTRIKTWTELVCSWHVHGKRSVVILFS